jgi:predicted DNA-binding transcriptional regulator YafY
MYVKQQIRKVIIEGSIIRIEYRKLDGDISRRMVSDIDYNNSYTDDGFYKDHIEGYCHLRHEERTFKISRIKTFQFL